MENHDMQISDYERQSPNKRGSHFGETHPKKIYCNIASAKFLASLSAMSISFMVGKSTMDID